MCWECKAWQPIETAPKTDMSGSEWISHEILAWLPNEEARNGGDIEVVWWEPCISGKTKNGNTVKGCWHNGHWPVYPTLWMELPKIPSEQI